MSPQRQILVTGGCGFVGRHLVAELLKEEPEIWIIDDLSTGKHPATWNNPALKLSHVQNFRNALAFEHVGGAGRVIFINSDFVSLALSELQRQPDLGHPNLPRFNEIYHLASIVGGRAMIDGDPLAVGIDLSIDSTFFMWAAKVNKPDHILYASSSAAYPVTLQQTDGAVRLSEEMIDFDNGLMKPDYTYGWSKLTGEYLARIAAAKYGIRVAVVRPFSGYGEDQDLAYPVPSIALRVAARHSPVRVWGTGLQGRDFVHIDDCVRACIDVCRTIIDGSAVNIGTGVLTSFKELAQLMVKVEGYQADVLGTDNRPVGVAQRYGSPDRIRSLVGWEPKISLEEGMRRVLNMAHQRLADGIEPTL